MRDGRREKREERREEREERREKREEGRGQRAESREQRAEKREERREKRDEGKTWGRAEHRREHGLRTPREEIAFTARSKIQSQSQIFRYGRIIFCLPHPPNFSDVFDLCLHWVSVIQFQSGSV